MPLIPPKVLTLSWKVDECKPLAAGRAASREVAHLSALSAAHGFLTVAAGPLPFSPATWDDDGNPTITISTSTSTATGTSGSGGNGGSGGGGYGGMLSSWPVSERAAAVRASLIALDSALAAGAYTGLNST